MNTIDNLLKFLVQNNIEDNDYISSLDKSVLLSLSKSIQSKKYITKNQANLIVRVLKENLVHIKSNLTSDLINMLEDPIFEKEFRTIVPVKTVELKFDSDNDTWLILVTIEHATDALKAIQKLPIWSRKSSTVTGSILTCELTEKNIVTIVDQLTPYKFSISDDIISHYNVISSWNKSEVENRYLLTNIKDINFQEHLTNELGKDTLVDELIINDRKLRYQYTTNNHFPSNSLTEIIANRPSPKIWVDKNKHSLKSLLSSLIILKRLPVLVVFDLQKEAELVLAMQELSDALDSLDITSNIGVYFRLSNQTIGSEFNNLIFKKQYNSNLDKNTLVASVLTNKLPKFFINNEWKPMSVISINTSLRHSKTAIYANCCDLIISYTSAEPIIETRNMWEYD